MHPAWLALLFVTSAASGAEFKPRVYVHVDPALEAQLGASSRGRIRELTDSVADLRQQSAKRRDIGSAENRAEADILLTVLDRRIEVNRSGETKYFGYTQTHYQSRYVLSFRVEARGASFETDTALAGAFVTWKRVAGAVAGDLERWARENSENLRGER
jgi:hypothetical protein